MRKIKFGDIFIAILLLALSFIPFFFLKTHQQTHNEEIAIVKVNNKTVKKLNLNQNTVWTYDKNGQRNVLEVRNKKVHMVEANCRDQVCVKEG
ncbi:NusG domain II-containing protein [uncultured Lactobacillus sp.]|uniref:NusG domain II-containing protein n=1 Tax=uncultured Lactobacillus sp. TaxID=153152 RepID=UPI0028062A3C|nr:NusG domain II-containing protein [uncultured Lactobacillus sp.]